MKASLSKSARLALATLVAFSSTAYAHTWAEQLTVIAPNGTFVGAPGYPRGYTPRIGGLTPDDNVYMLPDGHSVGNAFHTTDTICKPGWQTIGNQTKGYPALSASPGDHLAIRYRENGHVTNPQIPVGRPLGSGTVFVYGTAGPRNDDTYLGIHRVWNTQGTGGDGRGVLLATRPYDDGQCYQVNQTNAIFQDRRARFPVHPDAQPFGEENACQTDFQLPVSIAAKSYAVYWVWEWPLLTGPNGAQSSNQSYTICADVNIILGSAVSKAAAVSFVQGQPIAYAAIPQQLASPFLINPTARPQTWGGTTLPVGDIKTADAPAAAIPVSKPTASPAPASVSAPSTSPAKALADSVLATGATSAGFITVTATAAPVIVTQTTTETEADANSAPTTTSHRVTTITMTVTLDMTSSAISPDHSPAPSSSGSATPSSPSPSPSPSLSSASLFSIQPIPPIPAEATSSSPSSPSAFSAYKPRLRPPRFHL